jgi:hypothetical protein
MGKVIEGVGTTLTVGSAAFCFVTLGSISIDAGEKLDATCLSNSAWMTALPGTLKSVEDVTFTAQYQPENFDLIEAEVGVNQDLTINFAYQGTAIGDITFRGWLKNFSPDEGAIGAVWTGTGTLVVSNMTSGYAEQGPVWTVAP